MPRSAYTQFTAALSRLVHGDMYFSEFVGYAMQQLSAYVPYDIVKKGLREKGLALLLKPANKRLLKYFDGYKFDFDGVYLPDVRSNDVLKAGLAYQYNDLFKVHCEFAGNYSYKIVDQLDLRFPEGTYFYSGPDDEKILLNSGDIVIDAGAWIGDFSALAAHLVGETGKVYAFEPSTQTMEWLQKTASFYPNLETVNLGLGDVNMKISYQDDEGGGGKFLEAAEFWSEPKAEIVRLDDWASENKISKIDFIKADIEGLERKMLLGAQRVLKDFGPILSICTYHFPDDPVILKRIILESNPKYKIIQRRNKLFAFIP